MSTVINNIETSSLSTSVDKVFLRFLVGKWKISEDESLHDNVLDAGVVKTQEIDEDAEEDKNGREERTLLEVEKKEQNVKS